MSHFVVVIAKLEVVTIGFLKKTFSMHKEPCRGVCRAPRPYCMVGQALESLPSPNLGPEATQS